jgi:hypothetical protein
MGTHMMWLADAMRMLDTMLSCAVVAPLADMDMADFPAVEWSQTD